MMIDAKIAAEHLLWVWYTYGLGSRIGKDRRVYLEHRNMTAGEDAMDFLQEQGLVIDLGYECCLTRKGIDFMGLQEAHDNLVGADEPGDQA